MCCFKPDNDPRNWIIPANNDDGPLVITDDIEEFAKSPIISNRHITYNILDKNGKEILPKRVRKIWYYTEGYYIIEDNNEDDIMQPGGFFYSKDYKESYNVVTTDGVLVSKEWFEERITPSANGYVKIRRNNKQNLMDMTGRFIINEDVDFISYFNGRFAYFRRNNNLYKAYKNGFEVKCIFLNVIIKHRTLRRFFSKSIQKLTQLHLIAE